MEENTESRLQIQKLSHHSLSRRFSSWGRSSSTECLPGESKPQKQSVKTPNDQDWEDRGCFLPQACETPKHVIEMKRGSDLEDVTTMFSRSFEIAEHYHQRCSVDSGHASLDSEMSPDALRNITYALDENGASEQLRHCMQLYSSSKSFSPGMTSRTHRSCSADSAIVQGNVDVTCLTPSFETQITSEDEEQNQETIHRKRSLTIIQSVSCPVLAMPSVVISDHSNFTDQNIQMGEFMKPSQDYLQVTLDDIAGHIPLSRRLSTSSSCSFMSSLSSVSWDDDACQSDVSESSVASNSKRLGWKKVRNAVHWCPFLQTYRKQKYPWVQLAGHQGNFRVGEQGTILKKLCGREEICLKKLMNDALKPFVPEFKGRVETEEGEIYLELQDLLAGFDRACVMDVKIGLRTYLEEELAKAKEELKLRKDMYEKMVQIDPSEPTEEERSLKAITKPRYMVWRESISSTATLGFRVEGIKRADGSSSKDFKKTKTKDQVLAALRTFTHGYPNAVKTYLNRLMDINSVLETSEFFASHELIGSSLLFVHDMKNANVWLIDFAKTRRLPLNVHISHRDPWQMGNHEDGFLVGLKNLIELFQELHKQDQNHHEFPDLS
ncbi:inositol-trisphosphate 3-kinase A-like isoform X2 [Limulus polyphemus]|nr:inositol-trisphosphate 3-kinase A-like isoform X2 [Limulus polyphemus]XP_022237500.1 inositol-trisphosphate 3-kinase A-like isoform X2 [Limulus polyphemus]XP_022237501.1 inositol-trisphosphate 3-kinase A-like isoform X2 [Limulus polyphemus]